MSFTYLIFQSFFLGIFGTWIFEQVLKINKKLRNRYYKRHEVILGYHTHHSVYGLFFILAGMILFFSQWQNSAMFCEAFGCGIIVMHTISSGRLVFIEKQEK